MKCKRILSVFLILLAMAGSLLSLSACKNENAGNPPHSSVSLYKYGIDVGFLDRSGMHHVYGVGIDPDRLEEADVSPDSLIRPVGYECLGFYSEDGKMLFDKNGKICNFAAAKTIIDENKATGTATLLCVEMRLEPKTYQLTLHLNGDALSYGGEPQDTVEVTVSHFDFIEHIENYLPRAWRTGKHFTAWEVIYPDGYTEMISWQTGHYESCYMDVFSKDNLARTAARILSYADEQNRTPHMRPWFWGNDVDVYAYDGTSDTYRCFSVPNQTNLFTDNAEFAAFQPQSTPTMEHSFFAWSKSKTTYIPFDGTAFGDMELFWREVGEKKCTLNFMNGDAPLQVSVFDNDLNDLPEDWAISAPSGYTFAGWYAARDLSGEPVSVSEIPAYSEIEYGMTYYARWEKAE